MSIKDKVDTLDSLLASEQFQHDTYNGGHHEEATNKAFHHGMTTVFNILRDKRDRLAKCLPDDRPDSEALTRLRNIAAYHSDRLSEVLRHLHQQPELTDTGSVRWPVFAGMETHIRCARDVLREESRSERDGSVTIQGDLAHITVTSDAGQSGGRLAANRIEGGHRGPE